MPLHLVGQQVLALALQEGQIGNATWRQWLGTPFVLGTEAEGNADEVVRYMIDRGYLVDTGEGMLTVGVQAEAELGRKHFMELMAVFTAPPLFAVRHGRNEIGHVPDEVLLTKPTGGARVILLAGRNWKVLDVDWKRRLIAVEPSDERGVARWTGNGGFLGWQLAQTCRDVLTGIDPEGVEISRRATEKLVDVRAAAPWVQPDVTVLTSQEGRTRWWTFAGGRANAWFAAALAAKLGVAVTADGLSVTTTAPLTRQDIEQAIEASVPLGDVLESQVDEEALNGLKFADLLPPDLAKSVVAARLAAADAVQATVAEPFHTVHLD
jgi:ATP-dependent Lhr-like helicase